MRVLVTGGRGFLGAWILRDLAARGHTVRVFDIVDDRRLATQIAGLTVADACEWRVGDVVDRDAVLDAAEGCDGIIHLAGVLTPQCAADPVRGAQINLIGTLNVFEAALAWNITRLVYTSSAGVYGPDDGAFPAPTTHYGAFKLACEGCARAYWADRGLATTGFRPFVVYGPGRETGSSAGPSLACRAAAHDEAYVMPFTGATGLVYVEDVAAAYTAALETASSGARVFNLAGVKTTCAEVIAAIRKVVPHARIDATGPPLPIAADVDDRALRAAFGSLPLTSLDAGIAKTIAHYHRTGS